MDVLRMDFFGQILLRSGRGTTYGPADLVTFDADQTKEIGDVTVAVTPNQDGTGDPSPDNVRSVSGWTGCNVCRYRLEDNIATMSADTLANSQKCTFNYTDHDIEVTATGSYARVMFAFPATVGETYYMSFDAVSGTALRRVYIQSDTNWSDSSMLERVYINASDASQHFSRSFTATTNKICVGFYVTTSESSGSMSVANLSIAPCTKYTVDWSEDPGTVYGGSIDLTTGVLTVTHGNIASYAGEELPGAWISSMDVYAEGAVPTTGAQVVYELADPELYHLTPVPVTTLIGTNVMWADCGDITVTV